MMRLTALSLLAAGVMASNDTNATGASTAAPVSTDASCSVPSSTWIAGAALQNITFPPLVHVGSQVSECCDAMRDSVLMTLGTINPLSGLSMLNALPIGPDGAPADAGACWSHGGCRNTTAKDYFPAEVITNRRYICKNPACTYAWMSGLYNGAAPFNPTVYGAANYSDFCNVRFRGDLNTLIADNATSTSDATLYTTIIGEIDANYQTIATQEALATAEFMAAQAAAAAAAATTAAPSAAANGSSAAAAGAVTVTGSLTVGFTVPANKTVADLAADTAFKGALAASIRASLTDLPTTATVTITGITASARRSLMANIKRRLATLDLKVDYEISGVTEAQANAVYTEISNNGATFAAAVKTASVAEFTTAGLTGYAVDSVVAAAPTMVGATPAAATPVVLEDEASSSSAFSVAATGAIAMAAAASLF